MDSNELEEFYDNSLPSREVQLHEWTSYSNDWLTENLALNFLDEIEIVNTATESSSNAVETASTVSTESSSPLDDTKPLDIDDEALMKLPVRELNKKLRDLPKGNALLLRKRRRSLKNRGYALNCRNKRLDENISLEKENKVLQKEKEKLQEELSKTIKERDSLKKKYEQINNVFSTLCTTSALNLRSGVSVVPNS